MGRKRKAIGISRAITGTAFFVKNVEKIFKNWLLKVFSELKNY